MRIFFVSGCFTACACSFALRFILKDGMVLYSTDYQDVGGKTDWVCSHVERCGTAFSWWVIIFLVILQN